MFAALDPLSPTHKDMVVGRRDNNTFTFFCAKQALSFLIGIN
jgi:hypothetical protein